MVLRKRLVELMRLDKTRALLVTAQAKNGMLEAWILVTTIKFDYINKQRIGKLLWRRGGAVRLPQQSWRPVPVIRTAAQPEPSFT